jgi:cytochrome c5
MRLSLAVAFLLLLLLALPVAAQDEPPTPTPFPFTMPPQKSGGLIMPDFGPDATQADYGAEVYRLVCKACHGDKGQGLAPDWIAQWAPEDQNCWQTKCHAANHPPEGFVLPRDIPPVVGPALTGRFADGQQLHNYIAATMPWHAAGTLESDEYWQATAHLLEMNGVEVGNATLDPANAASFSLAQGSSQGGPAQTAPAAAATPPPPDATATRQAEMAAERAAEEAASEGWPWGWAALLLGSMAGIIWVIYTAVQRA